MKKYICGDRKGFTIIETSLVLAIAGLILVMAFIALPALQRQQRDTKRKDDTMLFVQAIKKYQQNNRGTLPKSDGRTQDALNSIVRDGEYNEWSDGTIGQKPWPKMYNDYLGEDFKSSEGEKYSFLIENPDASGNYTGYTYSRIVNASFEERWADWYVFIGATCEDGKPEKSSNNRNVAVVTKLEAGGTYCANT